MAQDDDFGKRGDGAAEGVPFEHGLDVFQAFVRAGQRLAEQQPEYPQPTGFNTRPCDIRP